MEIKSFFSYYSKEIPVENIFELTENILDDLYANSNETNQFNIFFHLQNEYFYLKNNNNIKELAYICYLISYYIFHPLTPPHSEELALAYAEMALELDNNTKYKDWIEEVKEGN